LKTTSTTVTKDAVDIKKEVEEIKIMPIPIPFQFQYRKVEPEEDLQS
jgi:hypothetical protein